MTKISLSDGYLTTQEVVILSRVPNNVTLTPDSRTKAFNGAFLAVVAPQSSGHHVLTLGTLEGLRFMCCFRFKLWWMTQRMGTCGKDVPVETQFLLVESKSVDEKILYTVFLPVLDGGFRSSLQGSDNNELQICLESGDPAITASQWQHALYIYTGSNPFKVISEAMSATKDHLQSFCLRDEKKLPGMLDWFGWCTWDAFYTDVSADGVRAGLQSLSAGGTPPRFLIIDDGWQSVAEDREQSAEQVVTSGTQFARRLTDIKENHKFQKKGEDDVTIGLEHLVEEAKQKYNLKYIYVWHSMVGYWGGLQPGLYGSELAYPVISPGMLNQQPSMAADSLTINGLGIVDPSKAFEFYDELHSYLASVGVDGVKVDVQSILETLGTGLGGRVELTKRYQKALESSIARNFADNGCIACMSHNTDGLYSSKQTAVVRASDDFWPADPASHTIHVASVAYNSLFLGEFMQPDWDMFQSLHPAAEYHGAARAVGGCGVYVSDKPGQHNFDLLKKLVLPDGSVLRAQYPGRPTRDSLFSDPTRDGISLLKIWNMNRHTGVLAAFNCQGAGWCEVEKVNRIHDESPLKVRGSVRANDVEFLCDIADDDWNGDSIIFSHRAGELVLVRKDAALPVALEHLQYEVFTIVPVKMLNAYLSFAPIGLVNMFNSGGAFISLEYAMKSGEYAVKIGVRGCGVFGVFCSQRPREVRVASISQEFKYTCENGLLTVQVNSVQLASLEIDF